jgi:tetratricopeptide (TPR) repeat protein
MAEEEIVILEDDSSDSTEVINILGDETILDDGNNSTKPSKEVKQRDPKKRRRNIIIGSLAALIITLLIGGGIWIASLAKDDPTPIPIDPEELAQELRKKTPQSPFEPSRLDTMLQKANLLYEQGNKIEALKIYEDIAVFNEALSQYNIGVAQMKEKDFEAALDSFKSAIANHENRAISALNAAVSALELDNQPLFKYYLDLAQAYLPEESNSPLYSYYVGLIHYYNNQYIESLSAFSHPSSEHYGERQAYLASKILSYLNSNYKAIDDLTRHRGTRNSLTMGLLHARIGEYVLAKEHLLKARENAEFEERALLALALVEAKLGNLSNTSKLLLEALEKYPQTAISRYPLHVSLKPSLFDTNQAQRDFKEGNFFDKEKRYDLLFYFAPYQIFNARQSIDTIRKGSLSIDLETPAEGIDALRTGSAISRVNAIISQGIRAALTHDVANANQLFQDALSAHSQHSVLHYNLGLTYAQLGNYTLAHKHFTTSYRLNPRNYLGGAFALMCGDLLDLPMENFIKDIKETLGSDDSLEENNPYTALIHLVENNIVSTVRWMEHEKESTPFHLMFDTIIARLSNNANAYVQNAQQLQQSLKNDLVANILGFHATYSENDIKDYARAIQIEFRKLDVDMNAFYYGPKVVKEQYVKLLQIGGLLYHERENLMQKVLTESRNLPQMMATLAYISLYTNHFEQAYTLYNQLIDEHEMQDSRTVFLGAVASIGSNHPENAIALLELSKLIDGNNVESRYALGLLYLEVKNFKGATIQFENIGDSGFDSKYFSFRIGD